MLVCCCFESTTRAKSLMVNNCIKSECLIPQSKFKLCVLFFLSRSFFYRDLSKSSISAPPPKRTLQKIHNKKPVPARTSRDTRVRRRVFFSLQLDFWTEPVLNNTVDVCVPPLSLDQVLSFVQSKGIEYTTNIEDIQRCVQLLPNNLRTQ